MNRIRLGILGASDIAYRRFLPALKKLSSFQFIGVAIAERQEWDDGCDEKTYEILYAEKKRKAQRFVQEFGGKIFGGYEKLLQSEEIDAVYVPLPPALHYPWCLKALKYGKHVLSEKPCTDRIEHTAKLIETAEQKGLAVYENYAFCLHRQVEVIRLMIEEGKIGNIRLIRSAFGFPYRTADDFRYSRKMGGGSLLDCGGYVLKAARLFMDDDIHVCISALHESIQHDVDIYGNAVISDKNGLEAQLSFGMDNSYKCELEIWGSKASILAPRIFTPPADLMPEVIIKGQDQNIVQVKADDQFVHMIEKFARCIADSRHRRLAAKEILQQGQLVEEVRAKNILNNI